MAPNSYEPKLVTLLREGYSRQQFFNDLGAGVIVGIVALPLAIAFAIASGVKPEQGLYTAIVAGFLISFCSGSRVQIGGPTGAFIVIVYGIVQTYGYDGLATATLLAGVLLVIMGLARLGSVIKYIPYPVTVGFTSGIALIILSGQVRDLLGLKMGSLPAGFVDKWIAYAHHLGGINPWAAGIGALSLLIILAWPRLTKRVPGSLAAILVTTVLVQGLGLPVATIGSVFGSVSAGLPVPRLPHLDWPLVTHMFSPALSIALLAGIESLLSAVVADGMTGRRHRSNTELVAQGVANIFAPIFGGIPATGAIARTATNIKNGGRTPVAGIIHAVTLLLIVLCFGRWAAFIPLPTLAGILVLVAYNMSEWRLFVKVFRSPRSDLLVQLATFSLTVLVDLTVAIQVGVVLAAFLFMRRMADVTQAGFVTALGDEEDVDDPQGVGQRTVPEGVEVFEIDGPFFFGAADKFKSALGQVRGTPRVLILRLRRVPAMDATGLHALEEVAGKVWREGGVLLLTGVNPQPLAVMKRAGFAALVGDDHVFPGLDEALAVARELVAETAGPPLSPAWPGTRVHTAAGH